MILIIGVIVARFTCNVGNSSVKRLSSGGIVFENDICTLIAEPERLICYVSAGARPITICKNEDTRTFSVDLDNIDVLLSHQYDENGIVTNFFCRERKASVVSRYQRKPFEGGDE